MATAGFVQADFEHLRNELTHRIVAVNAHNGEIPTNLRDPVSQDTGIGRHPRAHLVEPCPRPDERRDTRKRHGPATRSRRDRSRKLSIVHSGNGEIPAAERVRRGRSRDRHDRGLRGPIATPGPLSPNGVPLVHTRRKRRFDDVVLDAVERVEQRFSTELDGVEFAVEEVPDPASPPSGDGVPLGATITDDVGGQPARIVVFRRPIELRTVGRDELASLVRDVIVEQVAELLNLPPEDVDADYGTY